MSQEEKDLLFKDLCARLPYGVIVSPIDCGKAKLIGFKDVYAILFDLVSQKEYDKPWEIEYIKPYLRKMSSMTEEEYNEYRNIDNRSYSCPMDYAHFPAQERINWLNKKMFDYRGLIEKGLALEATNETYNKE